MKATSFIFSSENLKTKDVILKKYPEVRKKSAVMPLLNLAQKQNDGWISLAAVQYIADLLEVPYIKVYEVATFYTMYNLAPVGKYFVQVCTTTPCAIRGSGKIVEACKKYISSNEGHLSEDKKSSWIEVECLGACVNAPMIQINEDYYEDLDAISAEAEGTQFNRPADSTSDNSWSVNQWSDSAWEDWSGWIDYR